MTDISQPTETPPLRRDQVVERLRNAIITGRLKPGERLIERELCERMGVSRTSIREALRALEADHLIKSETRRGLVVARLTRKVISEIYEIRGVLEAVLVRSFTERASDAEIARLRSLYEEIVATPPDEPIAIIANITQFVDHMVKVINHEIIRDMLGKLHARISVTRVLAIAMPGRVMRGRRELAEVLDAVERRDGAQAAAWLATYVRHAGEAALQRFDEREAKKGQLEPDW